jgi:hypothetical protein
VNFGCDDKYRAGALSSSRTASAMVSAMISAAGLTEAIRSTTSPPWMMRVATSSCGAAS